MDNYIRAIESFGDGLSYERLLRRNFSRIRRASYDGIIIAGMGGSALAGEILRDTAQELRLKTPICIWKDYDLPSHTFRKPFYLFLSFSGNTEETVSGLQAALRTRGTAGRVAVVATAGTLLQLAEQKRLPSVSFDSGVLTPRQSTGILFYAIVSILHAAGLMPLAPTFPGLSATSSRERGRALARKLYKRLITVYTDEAHRALAYIWKIRFNETAKAQAFWNILPEMDHNELTAFDAPPKGRHFKTAALFLTDPKLPARLAKRFHITERLMRERKHLTVILPLAGRSKLEQAWRTLLLADWTSYFLGKLNGVPAHEFNITNPKIVFDLKKRMG